VSSTLANSQAPDSGSRGVLLEVRGVAKRFGPRDVLKSIFLNIASGEFLTLLGESGSGKTTLLRLIAGFEQPSAGEIWMAASGWTHFHRTNAASTLSSSTTRSFPICVSATMSPMACASKTRLPMKSAAALTELSAW